MAARAGGADYPGGAVIGVRPHDITLVAAQDSEAADLVGRIAVVEALGSTSLVHVQVDGLPDQLVRVLVSSDQRLLPDTTVGLALRHDRLHVFDGTTGRRLPSPAGRLAGGSG